MAAKHVQPIMRQQRSGSIINISSIAAIENTYNLVAYKTSKASSRIPDQLSGGMRQRAAIARARQ
jgi:NADP-dependent 3-hydroxy acid dehydrogenase YdfG